MVDPSPPPVLEASDPAAKPSHMAMLRNVSKSSIGHSRLSAPSAGSRTKANSPGHCPVPYNRNLFLRQGFTQEGPLLLTGRARIGLYSDLMNGVFARSRLESQVIRFARKARCRTMNLIGA